MSASQSRAAIQPGIEDGLEIESRSTDDLEHVGSGRLLLQRLGKFACARLYLVEQAHVLNRDHRLVGKGRDQIDLLVGKWLHGGTGERHHADRSSLSQQRDAEHGPELPQFYGFGQSVFRIGQHIRDVNHLGLKRGCPVRVPRPGNIGCCFMNSSNSRENP